MSEMQVWMQWVPNFSRLDIFVGIARIFFGFMFLAKLYVTIDAYEVSWAHRRPTANGREWPFYISLYALIAATACFTLGIFAGPAALLQYVLYVYLFHFASIYSLEDTVFQSLSLYFVFAGSGSALSLDRWLGVDTWDRFPANSVLPELALASAFGMIFLSAGVGKIGSPMWRRGLGVYYFFLLPLHRRIDSSFLTNNERFMYILNYAVLGMQCAALPMYLINAIPSGLIIWFLQFTFAVLLSTVFVFTWLGESMMIVLAIILWLLIDSGYEGLGYRLVQEVISLKGTWEQAFAVALIFALLACLWSAVVPHVKPEFRNGFLSFVNRSMRYVARYVWGFLPVELFSEKHTQGPVIYRAFANSGTEASEEIFRIFSPECMAGPERIWRATFIEVTQYKVAEACMEMDLYGEVKTGKRQEFILKLAQYIGGKVSKRCGSQPSWLLFKTLQLIPPSQYAGANKWYLKEQWVDAFCVDFNGGKAQGIRILNCPILKAPTGRDISRVSFAFNPDSR